MTATRGLPGIELAGTRRLSTTPARARSWRLDTLTGRLSEISGSSTGASLTVAAALVVEAQLRGEPAVWVSVGDATFFPPDLADSGVDLDALPVIRVADAPSAAGAADELLRSGAFVLVVLDLGEEVRLPIPVQTRLVGLAQKHRSALVCLTRKPSSTPSLGSLVSLRAESAVQRTAFDRFTWEIHILKDKHTGPGWRHAEVCHGPDGLC